MYQWPDYGSILAFVFGPRGELSRQHHRVNAIEKTPQERGSPRAEMLDTASVIEQDDLFPRVAGQMIEGIQQALYARHYLDVLVGEE
jgi:hypothetical protein